MDVDEIADLNVAMSTSESYENGSRMAEVAQVADASEGETVQKEGEAGGAYNGEENEQNINNTVKLLQTPNDRNVERIERERSSTGSIMAAVVAVAMALGAVLFHKAFRRRGKGKQRRIPNLRNFIEQLDIRPTEDAGTSLAGASVVASDMLAIASRAACKTDTASEATAKALQLLQAAGAAIRGRTKTEELHFGLLGQEGSAFNPGAPESIASGTASGVALAVAADAATIGLGIDHLSGIRVQAACSGLWGYRASTTAGPKEGVATLAGPLDALGWITKDPALLCKMGKAMQLPGVVSKGDLLQVIVAEDLFKAMVQDPQQLLLRATYKAARAWAGHEEVARGLMMNFLFDACPAAHYFIQDEKDRVDQRDIMEGLRAAAAAVQAAEFRSAYGHLLQQPQTAPAEVLDQLRRANEVSEEAVAQGRRVMEQAAEQLREILREGNLLMLPVLPSAPPDRSAAPEQLAAFERAALQLSSIAALAGLPQVCIPVHVPGQPPASVAVVGLQRSDMRLLTAAEKLGPMITDAAVKLAAAQQQRIAAGAANGNSADATPSPTRPTANGTAKRTTGNKPSTKSAAAVEEAETHKAAGNEFFKAGSYEDAVKAYSRAIELNPDNPVYYSNRAMAYLQIMQFAEAEADCDKALKREISVKTLLRRGTARRGKHDLEGARADFKQVLSLEPKNRQARSDLMALKEEENALRAEAEKMQAEATAEAAAATNEDDVFL
ncbi:Amidase 1 [Coccomyxa sp. Obi]|nr:Amidase 1 [Coccomyxa sp. Obi]